MGGGASVGILVTLGMVTFVGIILVVAFKAQARARDRRAQALSVVAAQLGGSVTPGTFWKQPRLQFEYLGHAAHFEFYSTGGKHPTYYTRLFFTFPSRPPFEVNIFPERFFSKLGKMLGGQDIQLGDEQFDAKFMIKGSSTERVHAMLKQQGIQDAIFELRALTMNDHIDISTRQYALRIQKLSWLDAPDLLLSMANLGKQVFSGYLAAAGSAAAMDSIPPAEEQERCAVCADAIEGSSRSCPRCGAAHHPECFELNDGCGRCSQAD